MKIRSQVENCERRTSWSAAFRAFTLIEVMVVVTLLSFIVLALMAVFSSTQRAFRASVTQSDILEGGRATMDLMVQDLKTMAASGGQSNNPAIDFRGQVNFYANTNSGYVPLVQSLVGVNDPTTMRTNVLENFFILSSGNQNGVPMWYGTGYMVVTNTTANSPLFALYRFSTNYPMAVSGAVSNLFRDFTNNFLNAPTNYSHLIDGVVDLRIRAFDINGVWMTNGYALGQPVTVKNVWFQPSTLGEVGFYMFSNTLPAAVEIDMATLEDRTLQRAESILDSNSRSNYLSQQAGKLHVFRQRVSIPNVDPSAYQ